MEKYYKNISFFALLKLKGDFLPIAITSAVFLGLNLSYYVEKVYLKRFEALKVMTFIRSFIL